MKHTQDLAPLSAANPPPLSLSLHFSNIAPPPRSCCYRTSPEVVLKPLERVPNEGQGHLGGLLLLGGGLEGRVVDFHGGGSLQLELLGGEVGGVGLGDEAGLEGRAEAPQVVKVDAGEERVLLDLVGADTAEAGLGVADEAIMGGRVLVVSGLNGV